MIKPVGLHLDNSPIEQPENTCRFALNGVLNSTQGDLYTYSKEQSNEVSYSLPEGYEFVGSIKLDNNNVILFSTNTTTSEIGLFNRGDYQSLINTPCLNFQTNKAVRGKYRIIKGCERIIYFVDNYNTDKAINIDQLDSYKDTSGEWDCNLMNLNPDYIVPEVEVVSIGNNGQLEAGSYAFAVELLDEDLNSVAVGTVTNYIPVFNDGLQSIYNEIYGSLTDSFPTIEGGTEITNKSFNLRLNNLDQSFKFARLIVFARNSSRGLAEEAFELQDYLPINDNTLEYTFTDLTNAVRTDVEVARVKSVKYATSSVIDIVDSRLVRGNVQEKVRDYSKFQLSANNIVARWTRKSINPLDIDEANNNKNPLSYQEGNSFVGDEVYAFGIQYVFTDGTISPVFHIPGRAANSTDKQLITIDNENSSHLESSTVERWKYEDTSSTSGEFAYYETDTNYPLDTDCDGEFIYGSLAGTPIRHHKFPCRSKVPASFLNSQGQLRVNILGVEFDNIEYPSSDIISHRFVTAIRRESDKTVIDSGFIKSTINFPTQIVEEGIVTEYPNHEDNYVFSLLSPLNSQITEDQVYGIVSPNTLAGNTPNADFIKLIGYTDYENTDSHLLNLDDTYIRGYIWEPTFTFATTPRFRSVLQDKLIAPNSIYNGGFDRPVINYGVSNSVYGVELNATLLDDFGELNDANKIFKVVLKKNNTPFQNLFNLQYRPITNLGQSSSYRGEGYVSNLNISDIYVSSSFSVNAFGTRSVNAYRAAYLTQLYVESTVNFDLRVEGTDCNTVPQITSNEPAFEYTNYIAGKVTDFDGSNYTPKPACPEYYRYNLDYQLKSGESSQLPVPFNFDYCSECLTKFPNRVIWSPKSFTEQITDNFRINLVNDFLTVGESKGQITGIHYEKNRLLLWTEDSVFLLTPNPRVINTDVDTAYIGTGEFLGVPAVEFSQVDYGFGGMQSRLAYVNTERGVVWCDQQAGKVYRFSSQIEDLTTNLFTWFRDNLDGNIEDFNLQFSYDPYYQRLLMHKKEFVNTGQLNPKDGTPIIINKSWTLSRQYDTWVSWHTWHPKLMFADRDQFYSTLDNTIYRHSSNSYNNFYGIDGKFQIEYVDRQALTVDLDTIMYYASPSDYPTFNQFIVYNDNQSTGIQELQEDQGYYQTWSNMIKTVTSSQDNYRISQIRNLNTTKPTTTNDWLDIQLEYTDNQGYIDKLPANIDYNINQWNLEPMRHKYFQIRLISDTNDQIVFHLTQTTKRHKPL